MGSAGGRKVGGEGMGKCGIYVDGAFGCAEKRRSMEGRLRNYEPTPDKISI